jgi:hypothetical protein
LDQATLSRLRQQDRADLERLLAALNGAINAIRRDECGDPSIMGSRGKIYACEGVFSVYAACRSPRHWTFVKRSLAGFCTVTQDGDDEGFLRLDRMPTTDEAATLRDVIGLRQTRPNAAANFAAHRGDLRAEDAPPAMECDVTAQVREASA